MPSPESKLVKFRTPDFNATIKPVVDELSKERGGASLTAPAVILEAVKFFKDNRPKS